ncbi:MAG: hypothetical protein R3F62_13585 [Planctomycetota bacterium]
MTPRHAGATTLTLLALVLSLASAGCGGSGGGRGGAPASATAASTSQQGQPTSSLPSSPPPPLPQAPASVGSPLDAYNLDVQSAWDVLQPTLLRQLGDAATTQLAGQRLAQGSLSLEVVRARLDPTTDLTTAPGFTQLQADRLVLRGPVRGSWQVVLTLDARLTLSLGPLSPAIDLPLTVSLRDLSFEVVIELDTSDPTRPRFRRVGAPTVDFSLKLDSTNRIVDRLGGLLTRPAELYARNAVAQALAGLAPALQGVAGFPGAIPAEGAPLLVDSGTATPFAELAKNVEQKILREHMPHGPLLVAVVDQPASTSWLDAYRDGGPGLQGTVVEHHRGHDGAIWTGQYLGAEALRYAVDPSPEALANVIRALEGVGVLLDVNGGSGLLARNAAPEASQVGQLLAPREFRRAQLNGQTWISYQGSIGISRDQYQGVFFGLALVYEHVPPLRSEAQRRLTSMLDYLIQNRWVVTEDRPAFNGQNGSRGPLVWVGVGAQKLAWLLSGFRMDPQRYSGEVAAAGPLAETCWVSMWLNTLGMGQYYKFNLAHTTLYTYFRLETDAARWQAMRRGYALLERYVGHHRNAYFDLIRTSIDPSTAPALYGAAKEALRRFARMHHRSKAPAVIDLSAVTYQAVPVLGYQPLPGGGVQLTSGVEAFPTEPLSMELRRLDGDFMWQRDPFTPAQPGDGSDRDEKHGLDLVLPWWLGRQLGAF